MFKYALAIKPVVVAGGIDGLDEQRKEIFRAVLTFMSTMIKQAKEVESVEITEDFNLVVTAKDDVEEILRKIGENAVITRL